MQKIEIHLNWENLVGNGSDDDIDIDSSKLEFETQLREKILDIYDAEITVEWNNTFCTKVIITSDDENDDGRF